MPPVQTSENLSKRYLKVLADPDSVVNVMNPPLFQESNSENLFKVVKMCLEYHVCSAREGIANGKSQGGSEEGG